VFSVSSAGQYTVHITNNNTSRGTVFVEASFTVASRGGSEASFTVASQRELNEGTYPLRIVQPYTNGSNTDQTLTIYDPVPVISSVNAVLNNSTQPCKVNQNCQLVVNGSGLMYGATYRIVQTGTNLVAATTPSTPVPWNTITPSAFSVFSSGTYTLRITNSNQAGGGMASAQAQFIIRP
jgi:hypothetical protein